MRAWIGRSLVAIGVVHTLVGLAFFGDVAGPILRDGVFNTVGPHTSPDRGIAFWYFMNGFLVLIVGGLLHHLERAGVGAPRFLAWSLLGLAVVGCVMIPASGFWLLFIPIAGLFFGGRAARRA